MKATIILELQAEILECVKSFGDILKTTEEVRNQFLGENMFVLGRKDPKEWLNSHGVSPWEAIEAVANWKDYHFGTYMTQEELTPLGVVEGVCYIASLSLFEECLKRFKTVEELTVYLESELGSGD